MKQGPLFDAIFVTISYKNMFNENNNIWTYLEFQYKYQITIIALLLFHFVPKDYNICLCM